MRLLFAFAILLAFATPLASQDPDRAAVETSGLKLIDVAADRAIGMGLSFLAKRQAEDGSFGSRTRPMYRANTGITGLCGLAFLAAGQTPDRGRYREVVSRAVAFLASQVQQNGLVVNPQSASYGPMYDHGFAMLFLCEVYGMLPDDPDVAGGVTSEQLREVIAGGVRIIVDSQTKEGGWRYQPTSDEADISVTVAQVMALRAARNAGFYVPKATVDAAVGYVRKCQNADGGFGYQLTRMKDSAFARSAAGVVALYSAGVYEGREIESGVNYLLAYRPRPNLFPPPGYFYYGHYYASQAMWQRGGKMWPLWFTSVRDELIKRQQKSTGAWVDSSICPEYGTAMALLVLQVPNQLLPIFER